MDWAAALGTITNGLGVLKAIKDIDSAYDRATYKAQIAELMSNLADVKIALLEGREELAASEKRCAEISANWNTRQAFVERRGLLYQPSQADSSKPVGLPICLRCDTVDHRLIFTVARLQGRGSECPQCRAAYAEATRYLEPSEPA